MKLHPRLSRAAIDLVLRFETFHSVARATADGWTIGFGHTRSAREGVEVSRADAEALLLYDLSEAAASVEAALFAPASQRQFEALTAFCFNIGAKNFRACSALARLNAGAELEAADEIERWRSAELGAGTQVVDALVRRRAAEKAHFLGLPEGFSKSPSAMLRPLPVGPTTSSEPPPPPLETSATLAAANGIQARLRELVPEPPAPQEAARQSGGEPPAPPSPPPIRKAAPAASAPIGFEPPSSPVAAPSPPSPPAPYVAAPPPPPPPERSLAAAPANDLHPAAPPLDAAVQGPLAAEPQAEALDEAPGQVGAPRLRLTTRHMFWVLAALGACLLAAAAVMILGARPSPESLLLGVVGVIMLTPGVYGLLGPRRSEV